MSETIGVDEKLREVGDQLEKMRGQLESLSSAIWQDIDHNDPSRLEEGVRFKQSYNDRRAALEASLMQMLALLREYPPSGPDVGVAELEGDLAEQPKEDLPEAGPVTPAGESATASQPVTPGLEQKVPFGFVLSGQTYTSASAWPLFYEALLQELYGKAPDKLTRLADTDGGLGQGGKRLFARVPDPLDDPLAIADAVFAEAEMDPQALLQVIKRLISYMGYPLDSFKILLKEKNRGTVETLSLAA